MELYIAIPKAVTDIYWNGLPEVSEPLGVFCVQPEVKKGMLGKMNVVGYSEALTGEKIIDHVPYATEYSIEYSDFDSSIDGEMQVGDLSWEVIDKSTADRILSREDLDKYLSYSPEQIREQLQNVRMKALNIARNRQNFETSGRYKRRKINPNDTFVVIPKAITDVYGNGLHESSESLGTFLVHPIIKKGLLGRSKVVGFCEAITGDEIIDRIPYATEYSIEYVDMDRNVDGREQVGDIAWEVVDKSTAERVMPPEEIEKYMSMSFDEIRNNLEGIRAKARSLGRKNIEEFKRMV